jgi:hypothetical protein
VLFLAGLALFALACAKPSEPPPSVEASEPSRAKGHDHAGATTAGATGATAKGPRAAANGHQSYGAPIDTTTPQVTLSEVLGSPSKFADKTVRMEGKITAVCQGMGCWLQLGDDKGSAHVKLRGHSFFVPKNSSGKTALVEARVLPVPDEGHCEEEAKEQTGVVAKVELEASGVEIF